MSQEYYKAMMLDCNVILNSRTSVEKTRSTRKHWLKGNIKLILITTGG